MKFQIREGAAASLGATAVVARILYGVTIDLPWLYNSGWISVLLGGVLALPVALAAAQLRAASAGKSPLSALNARRPVLARALPKARRPPKARPAPGRTLSSRPAR